jgi:methylglyoxal reductase
LLPVASAQQTAVLAYSPLAQGLLSGVFRRRALALHDGRLDEPRFFPANLQRIRRAMNGALAPIAQNHGASVSQIALAWLLAQPGLSAVVVGASSEGQAQANARAASLQLAAEERARIAAAFESLTLDPEAKLSKLEGIALKVARKGARIAAKIQALRT